MKKKIELLVLNILVAISFLAVPANENVAMADHLVTTTETYTSFKFDERMIVQSGDEVGFEFHVGTRTWSGSKIVPDGKTAWVHMNFYGVLRN